LKAPLEPVYDGRHAVHDSLRRNMHRFLALCLLVLSTNLYSQSNHTYTLAATRRPSPGATTMLRPSLCCTSNPATRSPSRRYSQIALPAWRKRASLPTRCSRICATSIRRSPATVPGDTSSTVLSKIGRAHV